MNEQLLFTIGMQRYSDDLERAERNYARRTLGGTNARSARNRIALGLIALATRLQPGLTVSVQRQVRPTTA